MEPALDVMSRALQGDPGARSFLEQTTSVYVLDVTDTANPKTYGCWNFIHQAMNEVERYEASHLPTGGAPALVNQCRLLSTMALRVARRSPSKDRSLVTTCISNASEYTASSSQLRWLIDLNLELREIVMGRIAAMAFDFSFHRMVGPHGQSAFADRVVMDTFCAVLSANAVASGPQAIQHFATEWVIPSSRNLPPFAVASVVLHLASEGIRKSSPAGTKETLQKLSSTVIVIVLAPTLSDATSDNSVGLSSRLTPHQEGTSTATVCLRAIKAWCAATDLSLPQINHICTKANMNIVSMLSDSMYSDCDQTVDALAELVESTVHLDEEKVMSEGRMNQVRLLLQVDEATFRARFSPEQLKTIEAKEMGTIVDELVSAIGLQRFRFVERQNKGEHAVCRNLVRIAVSVCNTFMEVQTGGELRPIESGVLNLLLKAASHPSVNICALVLPVLSSIVVVMSSLTQELLPMLQRRAILPHVIHDGTISFASHDVCGVNMTEFRAFRDDVLSDALVACWRANSTHYMESCTSAVEEFCAERSSVEVSLQLEAALFCIEIISTGGIGAAGVFPHGTEMARVLSALSLKSASLMMNALTRARACRMLRMFSTWVANEGKQGIVSDIALRSFMGFLSDSNEVELSSELLDVSPAPVTETSLLLKQMLCRCPGNFVDDASISTLRETWMATLVAAREPRRVAFDARLALGVGFVHVIRALVEDKRADLFNEIVAESLLRLEQGSSQQTDVEDTEKTAAVLSIVGDEIRVLSGLVSAFADERYQEVGTMQSGTTTSPDRRRFVSVPTYVLAAVRKALPSILHCASQLCGDESISFALKTLCSDLVPLSLVSNEQELLKELCSIIDSVLEPGKIEYVRLDVALSFLTSFVGSFGHMIEDAALRKLGGSAVSGQGDDLGRMLEQMFIKIISAAENSLGGIWKRQAEQGQGQGQVPFESRTQLTTDTDSTSSDCLSGTLDLLIKCLENCPVFVLHVPAGPGVQHSDDGLLRRAVDSATAYLSDENPDLAKSSLNFLRTLTNQPSQHPLFEAFVNESLARINGGIIDNLLSAACGSCDVSMLHDMAALLITILSTAPPNDVEAHLVSALQSDYFLLGDNARRATFLVLRKCQQRQLSISALGRFLDELWEIHQVEDTESLPASDIVAGFVRKYSMH